MTISDGQAHAIGQLPDVVNGDVLVFGEDPKFGRGARGFDAGSRSQLGEDRREVMAHRFRSQEELLRNFWVALSLGNEGQHFNFAPGQAGRIGAGRGQWTASGRWNVAYAQGTQTMGRL